MSPKKTDPAKAEAKGKKPVPKKTAEKAPVVDEKKAPAKVTTKAQKVQKKIVKGTHGTLYNLLLDLLGLCCNLGRGLLLVNDGSLFCCLLRHWLFALGLSLGGICF